MLSNLAKAVAISKANASSGIRSTCKWSSLSLFAVAGPTAAMRAPPRSRMSWNCLKKYSKNLLTPLGLVNTNQS